MFSWKRAQIPLCLGAFLISVLISLLTIAPSQAQSQASKTLPPLEITQGWHYLWGDVSINNLRNAKGCTKVEIANGNPCWQPFSFPERLWKSQQDQQQNNVWLGVRLPDGKWQSPTLYLGAVPNILEAYLDQQLIYTRLSPNSLPPANGEGYQWPIVPLDSNFSGKSLFINVYVGGDKSIYIGFFDRIVIGSKFNVIRCLFKDEISTVLGCIFILIGLWFSLTCLFRSQDKRLILAFGLLAIAGGVYNISQSTIIPLLFKDSMNWEYTRYTAFCFLPILTLIGFEQIFGSGYFSIIQRLWQIHIIYSVISLGLIFIYNSSWFYERYIDHYLLLASTIILLLHAIPIAITKKNYYAKLFSFGLSILAIAGMHDILVYRFELENWYQRFYPWGMLLFILSLALILERRFAETRRLLQEYNQKLETKNAALQEMDQLKNEFLANTSHELKTPLNGIIGIAESLIDGATGELSQPTSSNLSLIVSSGKRLTQLVNDLLDFSALKHKQINLRIKPVGMREITEVVLLLSRPLVGNKKLQLINQVSSSIPPVDADENRLQQILYNLVGNAIKFTERGTIKVSAEVVNYYLKITVSDTGIGIPPDKLDRIFEAFEQGDGSINRKYGGVGLGLAVTKKLVQLHGGDIDVESTPNLGSRFSFTLPISTGKVERKQREEVSKVQNYLAMASDSEHLISDHLMSNHLMSNHLMSDHLMSDHLISDHLISDQNLSSPSMKAFKILIVDDEPVNLQVLVNHLSLHNYKITQAVNGLDAFTKIRQGYRPDLILLDIMMPKMTGYEFCKKIRNKYLPNELPVVLLTAKNQISDLVAGFAAGANDYLTKPISKNELLARIKTHLQLAKINVAYGRFVPREFLQFLKRESILDVQLGDYVQKEMTVLFSDIRSFTSLSERMSPEENFNFINGYLSRVSPVIRNYNGFIDKYIGDAVMALFPEKADHALNAAIEMQKQVYLYNSHRHNSGYETIAIGIGLHKGSLILGTVGESQRMDTTVIADTVNLASRLESLTKIYGTEILISKPTLNYLDNRDSYHYRCLGRVKVKGKSQPVEIFEVYDANPENLIAFKSGTTPRFEEAVAYYVEEDFAQAQQIFEELLQINHQDRVVELYIERCAKARLFGVSELDIVIT
ncbi:MULTISPECIES: ATP-binding protein [Moorena]|uniref:Circadian input-output histidine kinase CikA n=1 Tax=Moorena producens 3L TaxID=489825 RepID=F4XWH0_9CYAN|nr:MULTISPECIES: ATP-binding protein [Moorena]EGJ31155.1 signal transduction histidine kinase [Moorena producens 3L]OLT66166.1 histidine kinase [Moorena producens 3L]